MKNNNFAITVFITGIISNIFINYIFPIGSMTKSQVVLESIALGLFSSGLILVLRRYFIEKIFRKK